MGLFFYLLNTIKDKYKSKSSLITHKFILFTSSIILFSFIYTIFLKIEDFDDNHTYYFKNKKKKKNKELSIINIYFEMLYFSAITQSTVGFGDISPKSPKAKIFVVLQILTSFILLSL